MVLTLESQCDLVQVREHSLRHRKTVCTSIQVDHALKQNLN